MSLIWLYIFSSLGIFTNHNSLFMWSDTCTWESLQIIHDEIFIRSDLLPLEIIDIHFLAWTVINTTKDINIVCKIKCAVKKSSIRHWTELNEFHRLKVEHHWVFGAGTIVMTSQNYDFIVRYQRGCLCLHRQWKFDGKNRPLIVCYIVLFDRIYPATSFVATKYVYVWIFEDNCRHRASSLVEVSYSLPPIHVDGVPLTAFKNTINGSATDGVYKVALIS